MCVKFLNAKRKTKSNETQHKKNREGQINECKREQKPKRMHARTHASKQAVYPSWAEVRASVPGYISALSRICVVLQGMEEGREQTH